jgi:hypothetical protein
MSVVIFLCVIICLFLTLTSLLWMPVVVVLYCLFEILIYDYNSKDMCKKYFESVYFLYYSNHFCVPVLLFDFLFLGNKVWKWFFLFNTHITISIGIFQIAWSMLLFLIHIALAIFFFFFALLRYIIRTFCDTVMYLIIKIIFFLKYIFIIFNNISIK